MKVPRFPAALFALLLTLLLAGCATKKIDWAGRVGSYTFDQAVAELGPPDKQAKLTDGTLVVEWLTRRGQPAVFATGGYSGGPYGGWMASPGYVSTVSLDYFLRLTFAPDGLLKAWKKLAK